jgi:flagellar biosynthesis/type III secretory pathway M-ring protein FliF/YscJ
MDPATAAAAQQAAQATQQLYQMGAVGAMLVLCVIALATVIFWVFKRMDTRLEETQRSADADRKEYSANMQDVAEKTGAHIAKSTEVLEKLSQGQTQILNRVNQFQCRHGSGPNGNNWGGQGG